MFIVVALFLDESGEVCSKLNRINKYTILLRPYVEWQRRDPSPSLSPAKAGFLPASAGLKMTKRKVLIHIN
jgi:hypothetical protein